MSANDDSDKHQQRRLPQSHILVLVASAVVKIAAVAEKALKGGCDGQIRDDFIIDCRTVLIDNRITVVLQNVLLSTQQSVRAKRSCSLAVCIR